MEFKNWIIVKHQKNIRILSPSYLPFYKNFLEEKGVLVNKDFSLSESFINWNLYSKTYDFFYDYEGCEKEVANDLLNSDLIKSKFLTMDFGYGNPIIEIEAKYFINNWYDFINGAHFETTVVSDDGLYICEFLKGGTLKSNFKIR
ncbi:MAG: hypothetical protein ABI723_08890 [Bacteroidia bacterium]